MTKDQEELAQRIIEMHRARKGILHQRNIDNIEWPHFHDREVVMGALKDYGLIERVYNRTSYRLTKDGWVFPGFAEYREKLLEEEENENLIKNLTIQQLRKDIFQLKNWWWIALLNAGISGIVAYLVSVYSN